MSFYQWEYSPSIKSYTGHLTCLLKAIPVIKLENNLIWTTKEVDYGKKKATNPKKSSNSCAPSGEDSVYVMYNSSLGYQSVVPVMKPEQLSETD